MGERKGAFWLLVSVVWHSELDNLFDTLLKVWRSCKPSALLGLASARAGAKDALTSALQGLFIPERFPFAFFNIQRSCTAGWPRYWRAIPVDRCFFGGVSKQIRLMVHARLTIGGGGGAGGGSSLRRGPACHKEQVVRDFFIFIFVTVCARAHARSYDPHHSLLHCHGPVRSFENL